MPASDPRISVKSRRRPGDFVLVGVTLTELGLLIHLTPTFAAADWIYVMQHLLVLIFALSRPQPLLQDNSLPASAAVIVAYAYPYAQVAYLRWAPGEPAWQNVGFVLVLSAACLSCTSLLTLNRRFGIWPALRGLVTKGPYRLVRHPMYLAYVIADIGYNMMEWNSGTVLMVMAGWASLLYRIHAEERILSRDDGWPAYADRVRYRLIPGIW